MMKAYVMVGLLAMNPFLVCWAESKHSVTTQQTLPQAEQEVFAQVAPILNVQPNQWKRAQFDWNQVEIQGRKLESKQSYPIEMAVDEQIVQTFKKLGWQEDTMQAADGVGEGFRGFIQHNRVCKLHFRQLDGINGTQAMRKIRYYVSVTCGKKPAL